VSGGGQLASVTVRTDPDGCRSTGQLPRLAECCQAEVKRRHGSELERLGMCCAERVQRQGASRIIRPDCLQRFAQNGDRLFRILFALANPGFVQKRDSEIGQMRAAVAVFWRRDGNCSAVQLKAFIQ
jgi:hypothetical protein